MTNKQYFTVLCMWFFTSLMTISPVLVSEEAHYRAGQNSKWWHGGSWFDQERQHGFRIAGASFCWISTYQCRWFYRGLKQIDSKVENHHACCWNKRRCADFFGYGQETSGKFKSLLLGCLLSLYLSFPLNIEGYRISNSFVLSHEDSSLLFHFVKYV